MPSRADVQRAPAWRLGLEWALRALTIVLLALLLWRALHPRRVADVTAHASSATLDAALAAWTREPPDRAVVALDSVPSPLQRDWLAAIRHAGVDLGWDGHASPTALSITPLADPAGAWGIDVATSRDARLTLRDGLGVLDSISRTAGPVERAVAPRIVGGVVVHSAAGSASAPPRDSLVLRRLLVEGAASWETRFTVAALQARGWTVDALMHVAPNVDVRVGAPSAPDTGRYAAAIAIDTSARLIAGGAATFVRSGGGLITLHDAASIGPTAPGAVVLEQGSGGDVRAARVGAGRVVRVSYPDVWRMRMTGGDSVADPVARHRAWLARVVAAAAYAPSRPAQRTWLDDPAPYADLVARVGARAKRGGSAARTSATALTGSLAASLSDTLLAMLLALALLGEWLSRRLRGAR